MRNPFSEAGRHIKKNPHVLHQVGRLCTDGAAPWKPDTTLYFIVSIGVCAWFDCTSRFDLDVDFIFATLYFSDHAFLGILNVAILELRFS